MSQPPSSAGGSAGKPRQSALDRIRQIRRGSSQGSLVPLPRAAYATQTASATAETTDRAEENKAEEEEAPADGERTDANSAPALMQNSARSDSVPPQATAQAAASRALPLHAVTPNTTSTTVPVHSALSEQLDLFRKAVRSGGSRGRSSARSSGGSSGGSSRRSSGQNSGHSSSRSSVRSDWSGSDGSHTSWFLSTSGGSRASGNSAVSLDTTDGVQYLVGRSVENMVEQLRDQLQDVALVHQGSSAGVHSHGRSSASLRSNVRHGSGASLRDGHDAGSKNNSSTSLHGARQSKDSSTASLRSFDFLLDTTHMRGAEDSMDTPGITPHPDGTASRTGSGTRLRELGQSTGVRGGTAHSDHNLAHVRGTSRARSDSVGVAESQTSVDLVTLVVGAAGGGRMSGDAAVRYPSRDSAGSSKRSTPEHATMGGAGRPHHRAPVTSSSSSSSSTTTTDGQAIPSAATILDMDHPERVPLTRRRSTVTISGPDGTAEEEATLRRVSSKSATTSRHSKEKRSKPKRSSRKYTRHNTGGNESARSSTRSSDGLRHAGDDVSHQVQRDDASPSMVVPKPMLADLSGLARALRQLNIEDEDADADADADAAGPWARDGAAAASATPDSQSVTQRNTSSTAGGGSESGSGSGSGSGKGHRKRRSFTLSPRRALRVAHLDAKNTDGTEDEEENKGATHAGGDAADDKEAAAPTVAALDVTHIHIIRRLGVGSFGEVFLCREPTDDSQLVAMKRVVLEGDNTKMEAMLAREVHMLSSLSHVNVVRYKGLYRVGGSGRSKRSSASSNGSSPPRPSSTAAAPVVQSPAAALQLQIRIQQMQLLCLQLLNQQHAQQQLLLQNPLAVSQAEQLFLHAQIHQVQMEQYQLLQQQMEMVSSGPLHTLQNQASTVPPRHRVSRDASPVLTGDGDGGGGHSGGLTSSSGSSDGSLRKFRLSDNGASGKRPPVADPPLIEEDDEADGKAPSAPEPGPRVRGRPSNLAGLRDRGSGSGSSSSSKGSKGVDAELEASSPLVSDATLPKSPQPYRKVFFYLVMEYVDGGHLHSLINWFRRVDDPEKGGTGVMPESYAAAIIVQVLRGLVYLHSKRIIHRDVQPANLLLTGASPGHALSVVPTDLQLPSQSVSEAELDVFNALKATGSSVGLEVPVVKIGDFGTAIKLAESQRLNQAVVGTPWFLAPEVIKLSKYSFAGDIWSVGACLFNMVTGHRPYHDSDEVQAMYKIATVGAPSLDTALPHDMPPLSAECRDFIGQCWKADWTQRPSAQDLLQHSFLAGWTIRRGSSQT